VPGIAVNRVTAFEFGSDNLSTGLAGALEDTRASVRPASRWEPMALARLIPGYITTSAGAHSPRLLI
jgi:hypothetical protein